MYDQEIPQAQTADNPVASRGKAAQPCVDKRYLYTTRSDRQEGNKMILDTASFFVDSSKIPKQERRHQEDKLSKASSSLFPIKMIAILEWT